MFGAGLHATIAVLHKEGGLSQGKVAGVLRTMFGIDAMRASACCGAAVCCSKPLRAGPCVSLAR
jgi:hypothetical protein